MIVFECQRILGKNAFAFIELIKGYKIQFVFNGQAFGSLDGNDIIILQHNLFIGRLDDHKLFLKGLEVLA
ncbi:hypothetical protein D3C73_1552280 [compost metagenome]